MSVPEMKYCMVCGTKLEMKYLGSEERDIPYCPSCKAYRFPIFNTAVSMIVMNEARNRILLIKQYGGDTYILVAGYVNKGEDAEHAARREVKEEVGLDAVSVHFNHSHYFAPSNTLMLNFTVIVSDTEVHEDWEIDSYKWFSKEDAQKNIRRPSLAQAFLDGYLNQKWVFPENF